MNLLALEASSTTCSVALQTTNAGHPAKIKSLYRTLPMQQGRLLLPLIDEILCAEGLALQQLDAVAYGCGPGSLTGVRIASCAAQGIGFVINRPLIPISSLAATAQAAYLEKKSPFVVVIQDARMGEVYWGCYKVNAWGQMELMGKEQQCSPDSISMEVWPDEWQGVGDGWDKYEDILGRQVDLGSHAINSKQIPTAEAVLMLARNRHNG